MGYSIFPILVNQMSNLFYIWHFTLDNIWRLYVIWLTPNPNIVSLPNVDAYTEIVEVERFDYLSNMLKIHLNVKIHCEALQNKWTVYS